MNLHPFNDRNHRGMAKSAGDIVGDVAKLAELQLKLAIADLKDCAKRLQWPAALITLGVFVFAAALTAALLGIAAMFHLWAGWKLPAALAAAAFIGLLLTVMLFAVAWPIAKKACQSFDRSAAEWNRNMQLLAGLGREDASRTPASQATPDESMTT